MCFLLRTISLLIFIIPGVLLSPTSEHRCHPDQRDALLEFINEFQVTELELSKTASWSNLTDCCSWDGVTCRNKSSGDVIALNLNSCYLTGPLRSNSSLFRLQSLRNLNLAYNDFISSSIPSEIKKLTALRHLNLSYSSFAGRIPNELLQLTKLVSLDLSSYISSNDLFTGRSFLTVLADSLTNLRDLRLSSVDISSTIPRNFVKLSSLRSIFVDDCNLSGVFPTDIFSMRSLQSVSFARNSKLAGNLPKIHPNNSLVMLDLSSTSLSGDLPDSISNLKSLNVLRLQNCSLSGKIPVWLGDLSLLTSIDLSSNRFSGEIPSSIGKLNRLTSLSFQNNNLTGKLPDSLLNLTKLSYIDLSFNGFTGFLPSNISKLSELINFKARGNSFSGNLPWSLFMIPPLLWIDLNENQLSGPIEFGNMSSPSMLQYLYLGDNNFDGKISRTISKLVNLQFLDLTRLNTSNEIDISIFSPLKSLSGLYLTGTRVSMKNMNSTIDFPSNLGTVRLSTCNITEFPQFLKNQKDLVYLDLATNQIPGKVPQWLWSLPLLSYADLSDNYFDGFEGSSSVLQGTYLLMLDLSLNRFQGLLPDLPPSLQIFFCFKNNFIGNIPQSICQLEMPELIDLSNNNFNGSIPKCLVNFINSLSALNLRGNNLRGSIPEIFTNATKLKALDIGHNRFIGRLPRTLINCTNLEVLNVESNKINDTFPLWLRNLPKLGILVLRSNKFYGPIHFPGVSSTFSTLRIIDISHNDLMGTIPSNYFKNWATMSSVRSHVHDSISMYIDNDPMNPHSYYSMILMNRGSAVELVRILKLYTTIDFSGNRFHGNIPESIGLMKDLIVLNLSSNAFTGNIPLSFVNLTQLESLDLSRNKLSGNIPSGLGSLSFLAFINLSYNKLKGLIPQTGQFPTQPCSAFSNNLELFGPPCGDIPKIKPEQNEAVNPREREEDEVISWIAFGIGAAPGLVFGWTIGYIVGSYKHEWFMNLVGRNKRRRR